MFVVRHTYIPEQHDRKIAHIIIECMFNHIMSQEPSMKILRQLNNLLGEGLFSTLLAQLKTILQIWGSTLQLGSFQVMMQ